MFRRNALLQLLVFSLTIILGVNLQAQNGFTKDKLSTLVPSESRFTTSLSGRWEQSYDESEWKGVNLPGSETVGKHVIYRKTIKIEKDIVKKYDWRLYFLGCDDEVEVYFNNYFIGRYFGGMTPFDVRIPPKMIYGGTNQVKLILTSANGGARKVKEQYIYAKKVYTGAIRDILLVGTPQVWVSDVQYETQLSRDLSSATLNATVNITAGDIEKISNSAQSNDSISGFTLNKSTFTIEAALRNALTGDIVAQASPQQINIENERTVPVSFSIGVGSPSLWSPDNPNLYKLTVKVTRNGQSIDDYSASVGFSDIRAANTTIGQQIVVNGQIFNINGVDYIEDYSRTGASLSPYRMEQDVIAMKTLGANVVRFRYNVPHPYFAYLCNKYGLFMLVELPAYDIPRSIIGLDEIKVRMKNIAERLISAYDNHPSVLGWGVSEGIEEGTAEALDFSSSLTKLFRASSKNFIYKTVTFGARAINTDGYDIIGFKDHRRFKNSYEIKNELLRMKSLVPNKPVFVSYGIPIQPGNHNGYSDPLSIESQAHYILNMYHIVREANFSGSVVWSYNDYALDNPLLITNNGDQYLASTGLLDRDRHQRLSYTTLQSLFNNEKEPLLNAGSYTERTPVSFIIVGIILSVIIIFLINRFRRFREYIFRSILRPYNFYADIRDQRIMSSVQTILLGLVISITMGLFFSSILYFYRASEVAQYVLMILIPSKILQELFFRLVWMPELLIVFISLICFLMIFIVSVVIRLFSLFIRGKIFYSDTFTITIWAGAPILLLLPFSIILIRLLVFSPALIWLVVAVAALLFIWILFRLLRAISVVFDVIPYRAYTIGLLFAAMVAIVFFGIYQYQSSILSYGQYLVYSILNS